MSLYKYNFSDIKEQAHAKELGVILAGAEEALRSARSELAAALSNQSRAYEELAYANEQKQVN